MLYVSATGSEIGYIWKQNICKDTLRDVKSFLWAFFYMQLIILLNA